MDEGKDEFDDVYDHEEADCRVLDLQRRVWKGLVKLLSEFEKGLAKRLPVNAKACGSAIRHSIFVHYGCSIHVSCYPPRLVLE